MSYKPGDEIFRCEPFAYVVSQKSSNEFCDWCLKRAESDKTLQRCSRCKIVRYCSSSCQRTAWTKGFHKEECQRLSALSGRTPPDTVRLMARIVFKLRSGGDKEAVDLPEGGSKRSFGDLMTHATDVMKDKERMEAFDAFYVVLNQYLGEEDQGISKSELFDIYCRVLINSFNLMDEDYLPIGIGLYLQASVLDHSCWPNATVVFSGKTAQVRAIGTFDSFAEARISYTNVVGTRATRQADLSKQYYFNCQCDECLMNNPGSEERERLKLGSVLCPGCKKSISVISIDNDSRTGQIRSSVDRVWIEHVIDITSSSKCPNAVLNKGPIETGLLKFHINFTMTSHRRLTDELTDKVFMNSGGHPEPMEMCRDFYEDMSEVFSPCDSSFTRVLEHLYESHLEANEWERAYKVGCQALEAYIRLCPQYDVNVANMALKVGKLASHLELDTAAMSHLQLAKAQLRVTHGTNHPIYSRSLTALIAELELIMKLDPRSLKPQAAIQST